MKEGSICNKCNHRAYCDMGDEHNNDNATIKGCYLYSEQKAETNADRIRAMTDEELSYYLDGLAGDGCPPQMSPVCNKERYKCNVRKCWLEWLKQEYKTN